MLPHELVHLTKNNAQPTSSEISAIRRELVTRRDQINVLRAQVLELETESQVLQAMVGPMRLLAVPPEIIGEILKCVLTTITDNKKIPAQVINLCLVCRQWREIAIATPQLWASVYLGLRRWQENLHPGVQRWIERGAQVPKRLWITRGLPDHNPPLMVYHHPIDKCPLNNKDLAKLLAITPSIQHLFVTCADMGCVQNLATLVRTIAGKNLWSSIPSVDIAVETGLNTENLDMSFGHFLAMIGPTESLTLALASSHQPLEDKPPPTLDLGMTKKLQLACNWDIQWVLGSLRTGTNLVDITLDCRGCGSFTDLLTPGAHQRCILPNATTLRIRHISCYGTQMDICLWLVMPLLEHLDVSFAYPGIKSSDPVWERLPDMLSTTIEGLLERAGRAGGLKKLRLHAMEPLSMANMIRILRPLRSLVHLILDYAPFESRFFTHVDYWSPPILPALTTLEILNIDTKCTIFNTNDIYSFTYRRCMTGAPATEKTDGSWVVRMEKVTMTMQRQVDESERHTEIPSEITALEGMDCDVSLVKKLDYITMYNTSSFAW